MKLLPIDHNRAELAGEWLAVIENSKWLDFGGSVVPTTVAVRLMSQRPAHCFRIFTPDDGETPIGLVALSDIHPVFRTARLWYVLGDKRFAGKGYTKRAVSELLKLAFERMELESVNAWAVEANAASLAVLRANGFQMIGRQRRCHLIDGRNYDRLLFDLLASDHGG